MSDLRAHRSRHVVIYYRYDVPAERVEGADGGCPIAAVDDIEAAGDQ